jgi:hypothetical protein
VKWKEYLEKKYLLEKKSDFRRDYHNFVIEDNGFFYGRADCNITQNIDEYLNHM